MLDRIQRALVIAPHPDDEVLGCGGTIARLAAMGREVHVAVATRGMLPRFDPAGAARVAAEMAVAHQRLGVTQTHHLDYPAAELDRVPQADLNAGLGDLMRAVAPDTLFLPFPGDIHRDHQLVFAAAMVAARPNPGAFPARIYAYETLSETNWNAPALTPAFAPTVFVDIGDYLAAKLEAFALFASQVRAAPDERSLATIGALATVRGATVHRSAAEAFVLIREVG
jgi:LmbE family N-acetylglucosaminyl deacetylase